MGSTESVSLGEVDGGVELVNGHLDFEFWRHKIGEGKGAAAMVGMMERSGERREGGKECSQGLYKGLTWGPQLKHFAQKLRFSRPQIEKSQRTKVV